jgi:hypothetical protein
MPCHLVGCGMTDQMQQMVSESVASSAQHADVVLINGHSDQVIKKCQRIAGLKALLKEWELSDNLDHDYIRGLKQRLLIVKNQLKNMCGHDGSERMDDW